MTVVTCHRIASDVYKYRVQRGGGFFGTEDVLLCVLLGGMLGFQLFMDLRIKLNPALLLVLGATAVRMALRLTAVKEECLLVISELGVQMESITYAGRRRCRFVDMSQICGVIINEGIHNHQVIFYMAFVLEGMDRMLLPFEHIFPRLATLYKIYRGTRKLVRKSDDPSRAAGAATQRPPTPEDEFAL